MAFFDKANLGRTGEGTAFYTGNDPHKAMGIAKGAQQEQIISSYSRTPKAGTLGNVMSDAIKSIGSRNKKS
jgi:hypothetical protein